MTIETSGVWGKQALDLVKEIGRRIAAISARTTNDQHHIFVSAFPSPFSERTRIAFLALSRRRTSSMGRKSIIELVPDSVDMCVYKDLL